MYRMKTKVLSILVSLLMVAGILPVRVNADYDDGKDCGFCGEYIWDDYVCDGCGNCAAGYTDCGDEHHCQECGACEANSEWCDACHMCIDCAIDTGSHCPECGICLTECDYCAECGLCVNCVDDWCTNCDTCYSCGVEAGRHCPDCGECSVNTGCMICHRCFDCGGQCNSGCEDACLICHIENNAACSECGNCFDEGGYEPCQSCGYCADCGDRWCDNCHMHNSCAIENECHCPECGNCYVDYDFCPICGLCSECVDFWCNDCGMCSACGIEDGTHCPDCGACTRDEGCLVCNRCFDCGGQCNSDCDDLCLICHLYNFLACEGCGNCYANDEYGICGGCGLCEECVDDWCEYCEMHVSCAVEIEAHCPECGSCFNDHPICPGCGLCYECVDNWCDNCGMCYSCGVDAEKHCAGCGECLADAQAYCTNCNLCNECADICTNCGNRCSECSDLCGNCGLCEDCADICPLCGEACTDCSVLCGGCGACENCAEICENHGDHCSECAELCGNCGFCEYCTIICESCGNACLDCSNFCGDCILCEDCCLANSTDAGCDHGVCIMSTDWDSHWATEHAGEEHNHVYRDWDCDENGHRSSCIVCGEPIDAPHTFSGSTCSVCGYKKTSFTVTFNSNGHGTAPSAQTIEAGHTAVRPSDPAVNGWTFGGWYLDAACTNAFDFSAPINSDTTLYAKWTEISTATETPSPATDTPAPASTPAEDEPATVPAADTPTQAPDAEQDNPAPGPAADTPEGAPSEGAPTPSPEPSQTPSSSDGGAAGFVERLYTIALGRTSDPAGSQDWVDAITLRGETGAGCARGFLYSPEFLNKGVSNEEFVTTLYRTFFDREPDQTGFNAWVEVLNNGTSKEEVIEGFINSTEWANLCLLYGIRNGGTGVPNIEIEPNQGTIDFATRLYTTCLGREADQAGLMAWARQLANQRDTGTGVARGFFFSSEFTNQNVDNGEYVTRLYRTFMGREPDQAGYNAWVEQLESGVSREEVFDGFAQSVEFARICATYGIVR